MRRPTDTQGIREWIAGTAAGRIAVLGVGNRRRGDDGAGSRLVGDWARRGYGSCIDGGEVPENHLEAVVRANPAVVLLIDAVDFGGGPGEIRVFGPDPLTGEGLSTHAGSLRTLARYLALRAGIRVQVIGIQPVSLAPGTGLDPRVAAGMQRLTAEILPLLGGEEHLQCAP